MECRSLQCGFLSNPEEEKLLKTWLAGKSGLDFSYYWKRMRKAGARLLRR